MSTVILGGGIVGSSIAYYVSANRSEAEIHIIDQSPELFSSASGYAAGLLARDWFAPSLAPLGALFFGLRHELATEQGGDKRWGFMKGTAFSLDTIRLEVLVEMTGNEQGQVGSTLQLSLKIPLRLNGRLG